MHLRSILLGTVSIVSAATLISTAARACDNDRYFCEPKAPADTAAAAPAPKSPLGTLVGSLLKPSVTGKTSPVVEPVQPIKNATRRKRASKKAIRSVADKAPVEEKAPPTFMQPVAMKPAATMPAGMPRAALAWAPIDVPSRVVLPLEEKDLRDNGRAAGLDDGIRIVSADEVNEVDLAAPAVSVRVIAVRPAASLPDETTGAAAQILSAAREGTPVDTSLLERVLMTFGGAFGAASAMRIFIG